jgi:hypothetical protein
MKLSREGDYSQRWADQDIQGTRDRIRDAAKRVLDGGVG